MLLILLASLSLASAQLTPSPTYSPPSISAGTASSTSTPNAQWAGVLGNSLWFYDAQRSGHLDAGSYGNRVPWRNDSALDDGSDWGIDLTGGWYDAGDYIKATFPLGFTLFGMAWGALTHGQGFDLVDQNAYLDGTLRWGFDWLMKAHPEDDVLFTQVGSSDIDNEYWGGDQDIPTPRPAYPVNSSFPGTDIWASTSSAFSIASMLYTPGLSWNITSSSGPPTSPSLANATYANMLLQHAQSLYNVSNSTTPYATFSDSVPAAGVAYSSSGWGDDLTLAALALALATNESQYYLDAYNHYVNYSLSGSQNVWNWDSRVPAVYVLFAEAASARPSLATEAGLGANLTGWQTETEAYFDRIINGKLKKGYLTKGGLLYYNGDSNDASLNPALAAAMLMFKYAPLASNPDKTVSYNAFARSQLNYAMGDNPMNVPYIVGMHPNSPQNPHSAPASGGSNISDIRNSPPTEAHVLYGALVGGPLSSDEFWDWRDDWVQNEVALDYNAMIPTLAAMQLMNETADPYYVSVQAGSYSIPTGEPCDDALPCSGRGGLSGGVIAGIVIGVLLGLAILVLIGIGIGKRKRWSPWYKRV